MDERGAEDSPRRDDGAQREPSMAIVPVKAGSPWPGPPAREGAYGPLGAYLWSALGGVALTFASFVGLAMLAFGYALASEQEEPGRVRPLACCLGLAGCAAMLALAQAAWVDYASLGATIVAGWVVAELVCRAKATISTDYAVIVALMAATALIVCAGALGAGTQPLSALTAPLDQSIEALTSDSQLGLGGYTAMLRWTWDIWPLVFFVSSACSVLAAHAGARLCEMLFHAPTRLWSIADVRAPIWSVVVLVVAVTLCGVGAIDAPWARVALVGGINGVLCVRFVFLLAGFGVLDWFLHRYRIGCLLRFLTIVIALYLEASFLVLSVVGLVDVWANFRQRGRGVEGAGGTGDSEKD